MSLEIENMDKNEMYTNFLHRIIDKDMEEGVYGGRVQTRFPPEPNGYLHIGSAYAINISHSIAQKYGGKFNLRFDDTNPAKEDIEYVDSITEDMKWMGFDWEDRLFYGSDYFDRIYEYAIELIKKGKAYVCELTPDEVREYRGTLTSPGIDSPYRNRSIEENLELFEKMRSGEFEAGSKVLRAKIDMGSPNINMRDPVMYRIQFISHYRTGDKWCIYPMYDFAHPLQDYIEGITHSLCSNEFKNHRPLYEWFLNELELKKPPKQREFGRMNITGAVTSKRYLRQLVTGGFVDGWDDPRLPTLRGLRRRGFTPESILNFLNEIGVSKDSSTVDIAMLEHSLRENLKEIVPCFMAVLKPIKLVITNYPEDQVEMMEIQNNPGNSELGSRNVAFTRELYIEEEDFMEIPCKGYHRLSLGNEVRLKGAYIIKCEEVVKNNKTGEIVEIRCTYDPETRSGLSGSARKVKGTIHWVSSKHAFNAEVHLYERLLPNDIEGEVGDWNECINPDSLLVLKNCFIEPELRAAKSGDRFQFIRLGYFCVDSKYTSSEKLVLNRIVPLKDTWKKNNK
ncbi:MAG: glutamine--tRNA ligase [Clostridiales bacterium]|nr:glutamine--tRNA ligase [Clostridiales bacterium]